MAKAKAKAVPKEKGKKSMAEMLKSYQKNKEYRDMFHDPNTAKNIDCIDSGSYIVNKILGLKGIAKGRMGEVSGMESSGKTTLVQAIALSVLEKKGKVLYFDYEHAFDTEYAKELGLDVDDPDHFLLIRPDTFEEGWGICRDFLDNVSDIDLIIIDSMAAMTPKAILEMSIEKSASIGLHARMCAQFCAEITKKISRSNTAMIVVNQVRNRIKMNPYDAGPDTTTTGGNAIKFYFSWRLELQKIGMMTETGDSIVDGSEQERPIGIRIQVKNVKNKLATPFLKSSIVVRFGQGIDNLESVIDVSVNKKYIKKSGAWFSFADDIKVVEDVLLSDTGAIQGRESVHAYLLKHESVLNQLTAKLVEKELPVKSDSDDEVAPEVTQIDEVTEAALAEAAEKASTKRSRKKKTEEKIVEEEVIVAKEEVLE